MSVGGLLDLGKGRENSVRILPKKIKSSVPRRERRCDKSREGRTEVDKEERVKERSSHIGNHDRREVST